MGTASVHARDFLRNRTVLIVEDEPLVAMLLADQIDEMEGVVVGPVDSVAAALALLEHCPVAAAIMDANLIDRDITPVAQRLLHDAVPFVIYTGTGLPDGLAAESERITLVMKPGRPLDALAPLLA